MQITIYSTPTCSFCKLAKEYFTAKNLPFKDFNVEEDQEAAKEMVQLTQDTTVPVIRIGDNVIVGFNRPLLDSLLS